MDKLKDDAYWKNLGIVLYEQGKFEEAENAFHILIELYPESSVPWAALGNAQHEQGKFEEAEESFLTAVELEPKDALSWNGLGIAQASQGKFKEAEKAYVTSIELEPNFPLPWNNLGVVLFDQDKFEESEKMFLTAIKLDSKAAFPWNNLGNALCKQDNFDDGENAYLTAIDRDSRFALPWLGLAQLNRRQGGGPLVMTYLRRFVYLGGFSAFSWSSNREVYSAFSSSSALEVYAELVEKAFHPLFVLNVTNLNNGLLLSSQWSVARNRAEAALVKPMQCLDVLTNLDESFENLFLKALICFRYGDISDDTFDRINDMYEEEPLGQYYLLVYLNSLAMETGPSEEEAMGYARQVENNCADPEQLFVAGLIYQFCEQNDRAASCWEKNGQHLASMYLLMQLKHEQGKNDERDVLASKILDEENRRLKIEEVGFLGGLAKIDEYDCQKKEDREEIVRCLRYDEVSDAVETLHNLVEENPKNPAWSQFLEEPVSGLKYGPCSIIDIWSVNPEQREKYRDDLVKREERAAELLNELKDIDTVFYPPEDRLVGDTMTKTEDSVAMYLRTGKDAPPVKQKIIGYLYQREKLDATATICLLLYFEQYHNKTLNRKRLAEFIISAAGSLGGVVLSTLLSDSLPAQLASAGAGAGAGAILGPALSNVIENVAFSVRYEEYRDFRKNVVEELQV